MCLTKVARRCCLDAVAAPPRSVDGSAVVHLLWARLLPYASRCHMMGASVALDAALGAPPLPCVFKSIFAISAKRGVKNDIDLKAHA